MEVREGVAKFRREDTVRRSRENLPGVVKRFLEGPKRDGPVLEYSVYSLCYLFRDLLWMFLLFFPIFLKTLWRTFSTKKEKELKNKVVLVSRTEEWKKNWPMKRRKHQHDKRGHSDPFIIAGDYRLKIKIDDNLRVTGAGNGLGKEMAIQFARKGCKVACVDIREDWNKRTATIIAYAVEDEDMVKAYTCDVSKASETKILAEKVLEDFGRVDILVNNAGILFANTLTGGDDAVIKRVIDVNFLSGFWMVRAFLPSMMKKKSGHIVFINSGSGVNPLAKSSAYCASKFALTGLAYAMQEEMRLNPEYGNIKVTSVHPYFIKTNPDHVKNWRLRLPPMEVKDAATMIIRGIRREYQNFGVPAMDMGYWMSSAIRFFPRELYNIFLDVFYTDITVEDSQKKSTEENKS